MYSTVYNTVNGILYGRSSTVYGTAYILWYAYGTVYVRTSYGIVHGTVGLYGTVYGTCTVYGSNF